MMGYSRRSTGCIAIFAFAVTASLSLVTETVFSQTTETEPFDISSPDRVMIEQDTKQILQRPEFRHLTRERQITSDSPFDLEDLLKEQSKQETSNNKFALSAFAGIVILALSYTLIACACGLILYLLYKSLTGFKHIRIFNDKTHREELQGEMTLEQIASPAESEAATYLQRAKALAQIGDYQNAIIQLLYGSMSFIERSGWIRFQKGLTYRDYLRAARPHGLPGDSFRQMIRTYEPLGFGRREATREHFESTLRHYEAAFQKKA
jgi:hypothetical protein